MTNALTAAAIATVLFFARYGIGHNQQPAAKAEAIRTVTVALPAGQCRQILARNERTAIRALGQALDGHHAKAMNIAAHIAAVTDRCSR